MLEAGADPNDSQAAYNRLFTPDNTCLDLLLEFGLGEHDRNNWYIEDGLPHPGETMHYQLIQAIHRGYVERAKLLIDHGVDLERPDDSYDNRTKGKTPLEAALLLGAPEIATLLREAGAKEPDFSPADAFAAACMRGDTEAASGMLDVDPGLRNDQREMLCDAVKLRNHAALATMIALGLDLNDPNGRTPLHEAAMQGDVEAAKMLLDASADATIRDPDHYSPPIGWAQYLEKPETIPLLENAAMDVFTAAAYGKLDQLEARLAEDPSRLDRRFADAKPGDKPWPMDWMTPLAFAVANGRAEAVRFLLNRGADPAVSDGENSIRAFAAKRGDEEIVAMLKADGHRE